MVYPPLSYPEKVDFWYSVYIRYIYGGVYQREGDPERINRSALGAMMAWGPLHDGFRLLWLLLLSRSVLLRPKYKR